MNTLITRASTLLESAATWIVDNPLLFFALVFLVFALGIGRVLWLALHVRDGCHREW